MAGMDGPVDLIALAAWMDAGHMAGRRFARARAAGGRGGFPTGAELVEH
jgi:hypothetical protein